MSIIFQTLSKLQATSQGEPPPMAEEGTQDTITGRSKLFLRRRLIVAVAVAGVFIVLGFAFIFGMNQLADHLGRPNGEAIANESIPLSDNSTIIKEQTSHPVAAQVTTPRYLPPDGPDQTAKEAVGTQPLSKEVVDSRQTAFNAPMANAPRKTEQAKHAIDSNADPSMVAPSSSTRAITSFEVDDADKPAPNDAAPEKVSEIPEPMSAEQRKAEQAHKAAREKSERISHLVSQLESALSGPTMENNRIETMLDQLEKLKRPGSPYVDKMRAYWLLKEQKYDQAKTILEKLAAADQEDVEVGINLAVIDIHSGDTQAALRRLQRLKKASPDNMQIADLIRKLQ